MDAAGDRSRLDQMRQLLEAALGVQAADRVAFVRGQAGSDEALAQAVLELLRAIDDGANTAAALVGEVRRAAAAEDPAAGVRFTPLPQAVEERFYAALLGGDPAALSGAVATLGRELPESRPALVQRLEWFHSREFLAEDGEDLLRRLRRIWSPARHARRYQHLHDLGEGGFGAVSVVRDRLLGRKVARKTLRRKWGAALHLVHPELGHRFLDEAQVAAQLLHPGIPLLHDIGVTALGVPFFTMRLVRGETLEAIVHRHHHGDAAWPRDRVLRLLLDVADAVDYAHGEHVLHRDLKTLNVLVGRFGEACVLDWGMSHAHRLASRQRDDAGVVVDRVARLLASRGGSPGFTAPEQWDGQSHAGCDVFSLGAILHVVLFGMPPPRLQRGTEHRLPPPAKRADRPLHAVCERAIAADPTRRYRTMREFRDALAGCVAALTRPSLWSRLSRPWSRQRAAQPTTATLPAADGRGAWRALKPPAVEVSLVQPVGPATTLGATAGDARHAGLAQRLATVADLGASFEWFDAGEVVGHGGLAFVERRLDTRLGRPVALKRSRHDRSDELEAEILSRNLDEPQVTGQLDHPAVLTPHDLGVDAEGSLFVVQPFVASGTLADFVHRHGPSAWAASGRLLLQAARALAHAHERGVLHRDVKPHNILLGRHGDAYLADWGLALLLGEARAGDSEPIRVHRGEDFAEAGWLSRDIGTDAPGHIVGTPLYMAPERFGDAPPQRSSDVYSLGCCLFELLCGGGRFTEQVGVMAVFRVVASEPHPAVRTRRPAAPRHLAEVCDQALAFNPAHRFQDAGEFALALEQALSRSA